MASFDFADFPDTSVSPIETISTGIIATVFPGLVSFDLNSLDVRNSGTRIDATFSLGENIYEYSFTGTNLLERNNRLVEGTLDGFDFVFNDLDVASAQGLNVDVADLLARYPDPMPGEILNDLVDIGWTARGTSGDDVFGDEPFVVTAGNVRSNGVDDVDGLGGNDLIFLAGGDDRANGGRGDDVINGGAGRDTITGGAGDDTLVGGGGRDRLIGGGGSDTIRGAGGSDTMQGRGGSDRMFGGSGNDLMNGNAGNDFLDGGRQADNLRGKIGNDVLKGGAGQDVLDGGDGSDTLNGGNLGDLLRGGNQADLILGNKGADRLNGNAGNDVLLGGRGSDDLFGGRLKDVLDGGFGDDVLDGGKGRDTFQFTQGGDDVIVDFEVDFDTLDLSGVSGVQDAVDRRDGAFIEFNGGSVLVLGVDADDLSF